MSLTPHTIGHDRPLSVARRLMHEHGIRHLLTASPDDALEDVVRRMLARKVGSAVAIEGGHVVGVLTTTDTLRALLDRLERG